MPLPNEHSARVKSIGQFKRDTMRSKSINGGVRAIMGKLKDGAGEMIVQSYRFKKDQYTESDAKKWLSDNDVSVIKFEPALKTVQSFERVINIQCNALSLHPQEIKQRIPMSVMAEIKKNDMSPHFRAYSIMQDGIAKPRVIGESNALPTKWSKKIVQSLKGVVKRGIQFFVGHNSDNSTNDRKSVGQVVANFSKKIGDQLHSIVIGYFPDKIESEKYDVCSIEGNILAQDFESISIVKEIKDITGIALGNSAYDKPAFPGAVYMGSIQAFGADAQKSTSDENKNSKEITMPTFEEIKKAVRDMNIFPAQLYSEDDLKKDNQFSKLFNDLESSQKSLTEKETEFNTKLEERDEKIKQLEKDMALATSKDKLSKSFPEGLTDNQKTFIEKKFKPETMEDLTDENMEKFINDSLSEYKEYASLFGSDNDEPLDPPSNNDDDEIDDIDKIVDQVATKQTQEV